VENYRTFSKQDNFKKYGKYEKSLSEKKYLEIKNSQSDTF